MTSTLLKGGLDFVEDIRCRSEQLYRSERRSERDITAPRRGEEGMDIMRDILGSVALAQVQGENNLPPNPTGHHPYCMVAELG